MLFRPLDRIQVVNGAEGQTRTVDTGIFSAVLYHLSYLGNKTYYQICAYALSRRIILCPWLTSIYYSLSDLLLMGHE